MASTQISRPRARREGITVQAVKDEIILYDSAQDETHLLNQTSAIVWKLCDGTHTISEMAERVAQSTGTPSNPELVRFALSQMERKGLLADKLELGVTGTLTRRQFLSKFALAAAVMPIVQTMRVPSAQQASSCAGLGQSCANMPCCPPWTCGATAPICLGSS